MSVDNRPADIESDTHPAHAEELSVDDKDLRLFDVERYPA